MSLNIGSTNDPIATAPCHEAEIDAELSGHSASARHGENALICRSHGCCGRCRRGRDSCGGRLRSNSRSDGRARSCADAGQVKDDRPHRNSLTGRDQVLGDDAFCWRGDLHRRLICHHLDDRLVLFNAGAFIRDPTDDLSFSDALADVRELKFEQL
jgi:hypothetical protein